MMATVLGVTAPIYLLMALGWGITKGGLLGLTELRALGRFLMVVGLPALMFDAVTRRPIEALFDARYVAAYTVGSWIALGLGLLWARWRWTRRGAPGAEAALPPLQAMGMASSNTGYIGYPLAVALLGQGPASVVALSFLVENLLVIPLALAMADAAMLRQAQAQPPAWHQVLKQTGSSLLRNPIVVAVLLGLILSWLGWSLPGVVQRVVSMLATAATPLALVLVGGLLVGVGQGAVAQQRTELAGVALGKLVLHPLAVGLAVWLFEPRDESARVAAVLFAAVPMLGVYPVFAQKYQQSAFCAAALLVTTLASFGTVNLLLVLLRGV